jgi:hypothetical protein
MQYGDWIPIEYKGKIGFVYVIYVIEKPIKVKNIFKSQKNTNRGKNNPFN